MYCIYKWTNKTNGKSYIGASNDVQRRWLKHTGDAQRGSSLPFHRAIQKYGKHDWNLEILHSNLTVDAAFTQESMCIKEHNSKVPSGYNLTEGGRGLHNHQFSAEHRQHLKWSDARRQRYQDFCALGLHPSKGKPSKLKGKLRPEAAIWQSKNWLVTTPDGNTLHINNLAAFCRNNGLNNAHMSRVAQHALTSHKGYRCEKVD